MANGTNVHNSPRSSNVPLLAALWSLLDGIWGLLKGSCGVLDISNMFFGAHFPCWRSNWTFREGMLYPGPKGPSTQM